MAVGGAGWLFLGRKGLAGSTGGRNGMFSAGAGSFGNAGVNVAGRSEGAAGRTGGLSRGLGRAVAAGRTCAGGSIDAG